jgi:hypothetical protein
MLKFKKKADKERKKIEDAINKGEQGNKKQIGEQAEQINDDELDWKDVWSSKISLIDTVHIFFGKSWDVNLRVLWDIYLLSGHQHWQGDGVTLRNQEVAAISMRPFVQPFATLRTRDSIEDEIEGAEEPTQTMLGFLRTGGVQVSYIGARSELLQPAGQILYEVFSDLPDTHEYKAVRKQLALAIGWIAVAACDKFWSDDSTTIPICGPFVYFCLKKAARHTQIAAKLIESKELASEVNDKTNSSLLAIASTAEIVSMKNGLDHWISGVSEEHISKYQKYHSIGYRMWEMDAIPQAVGFFGLAWKSFNKSVEKKCKKKK